MARTTLDLRVLLLALAAGCASEDTIEVGLGLSDAGPASDAAAPEQDGGPAGSDAGAAGGDAGVLLPVEMHTDDFEAAALDPSWTLFGGDTASATVEGGALTLRMNRAALWYNARTAALLYKEITGDFKVTARVHARKTSDLSAAPTNPIHLGGLMARDPRGPRENYVFIVAGRDPDDLSVETKTTTDGDSTFQGPGWPSGDAELRLCRVGDTFVLAKREIGAPSFVVAETFVRPDLPATLQVGANAYASSTNGGPDFTIRFDEVTFASVSDAAGCAQD